MAMMTFDCLRIAAFSFKPFHLKVQVEIWLNQHEY